MRQGVCRACGCVDERACEGGCFWADDGQTLCSACVPSIKKLRESLNDILAMLILRGGHTDSHAVRNAYTLLQQMGGPIRMNITAAMDELDATRRTLRSPPPPKPLPRASQRPKKT